MQIEFNDRSSNWKFQFPYRDATCSTSCAYICMEILQSEIKNSNFSKGKHMYYAHMPTTTWESCSLKSEIPILIIWNEKLTCSWSINGRRGAAKECEEHIAAYRNRRVQCVVFALCGFWKKRNKGRERVGCVVKIIRVVIKTNIDLYLYFRKKLYCL